MKWPGTFTIADARKIQEQIRKKVRLVPFRGDPEYVAGVDAAFSEDEVFVAACLFRYTDITLMEQAHTVQKLRFSYVPGYLSFREGPAIVSAVKKLRTKPDLILVDGQGIAHPRGAGIASHLGVTLNVPAIGCAKSRLIGDYKEPATKKGTWSRLEYNGRIVGAVLRTRDGVNPLFISPGHRMTWKARYGSCSRARVNTVSPNPCGVQTCWQGELKPLSHREHRGHGDNI